MSYMLSISPCNCVRGVNLDVPPFLANVVDSNNLPASNIFIDSIELKKGNSTNNYNVGLSFQSITDLMVWLNESFAYTHLLAGIFNLDGPFITYTNPEKLTKIEVMAILSTKMLVYKFGNGGGNTPNQPYAAELLNGSIIPGSLLLGSNIIGIWWNSQRIDFVSNKVTQNSINASLSFAANYSDGNMWIQVAQKVSPQVFDLTLPFQLS